MKGVSEVILGATLILVAILAVVLGLIFVLLAELYCSLLLRRRNLRDSNSDNAIPIATTQTITTTTRANASPSHTSHPQQQSPPPPFSSIYAQGVLQAPRSMLLPTVSRKEDIAGPKKQLSEFLHQVVEIQTQESNASPCQVGVLSASSSSFQPEMLMSKAPQKPIHKDTDQPCSGGGEHLELVYISNPIYESQGSGENTPFMTPETSPSRLESGSSGEASSPPCGASSYTPPLSPMKKLPAEASCSVSLRDSRSLGTSGSDFHSNKCLSSLFSASPCTSPAW
ncbi:uncharacterized protein LOC130714879 [Lotus japonicus]|uniref:uncharacterized protein LOC130714879 n=1 Tax=Lotus japonicus TaxID=34305 RepID=UPI00258A972C|nr:uncharacterized protein LOC130714879 [Lotus japonicus]